MRPDCAVERTCSSSTDDPLATVTVNTTANCSPVCCWLKFSSLNTEYIVQWIAATIAASVAAIGCNDDRYDTIR